MRTQANTLSTRSVGLQCAALLVFVLIGMAASLWLPKLSGALLCLLVAAPIAAIASLLGLKYAATSFGQLTRRLGLWHWMLVLVFVSGLVFRIRAVSEIRETSVDFWALYRMGLMAVVALVLMVSLAIRRSHWVKSVVHGALGTLALYGLVCVISTSWSVFPSWTLYKSLEYLTDLALTAAVIGSVASIDEYRTFLDWTWVLYGLLLTSVWVGAVVAPSLAFVRNAGVFGFELQGVMPQLGANGVGEIGALLGVVAFARMIGPQAMGGSRLWYAFVFIVSLCTLILSQTRSAVAGFTVGVLLAAMCRNLRLAILGLLICLLMVFVLSGMPSVLWAYLQRGQSAELYHSLSGRTDWWQFAWLKILQRPWTGYGGFAGGRFVVLANLGDTATSSVHNSYIEVVLGCGIFGLLPLLAALVRTWWQLASVCFTSLLFNLERQLAVESLCVLAVITTRSFFSVTIIWHPALDFLIVLGYAELLRYKRLAIRLQRTQPKVDSIARLLPSQSLWPELR